MTLAQQIAALAKPVGDAKFFDLLWSAFTAGNQTADSNNTGIATPAALYRVPPTIMVGLLTGVDFSLIIRGHGQFTTTTGGTQQVLDLTTVGFSQGIADLPQGTSVFVYENGSPLAYDSVDYAAGTVTVTPATTGSTLDVFAPPLQGQAQLQVVLPTAGLGGIAVPIWARDFSVLHQAPQVGNDSAPKLAGRGEYIPLYPGWQFGIYVDTPVTVEWVANAKQRALFHAKQRQVRPTNADLTKLESIWLANRQGA